MDFSEQGVEEMKEIVMHYGRDSAGVAGGLGQTTFSNPIDMCLFNVNACGFRKFSQPSYAMGTGAVRTGTYHYVEDGERTGNVAEFNFSDRGVDELVDGKEIGISFEEAGGYIHCWQTALSNPEDAYLSCIYMVNGFWNAWHVWGEVDAGNIRLRDAFRKDDEYVSLEGKDRLVEISGDGGFSMDSFHGYYCGSHLYADPDDTETLYLDACGLWELKRAD